LQRPARYDVQTQPRQRPDNVKEAIVVRRDQRLHDFVFDRGNAVASILFYRDFIGLAELR